MVVSILINIALQIGYFIVAIYLGGFIISLINRGFYGLFNNSPAVIYATGFIGTPIHETSHALMCLLFAHTIDEIKFFQIDDENGVLGYVRHSYNPKNIYAVIGNYFIGVAPIVMGCGLLCLSMRLLLPQVFVAVGEVGAVLNPSDFSFALLGKRADALVALFFSEIASWRFWVFLLLNLCIALHMNMSGADIKGTLGALPFLLLIFVILNFALGFWKTGYSAFTGFMNGVGIWIGVILLLAICFALFYLIVGLLIKLIVKMLAAMFAKR